MNMNIANKLTVLRILLVPFFVACLIIEFPYANVAAGVIFVAASITDMLDGRLARKLNIITDFGKFADPLADKILVISACVCLVEKLILPAWSVIIILFREFVVSGLRMTAASKNIVIPADNLGKIKTVRRLIPLKAARNTHFMPNIN